MSDAPKTFSEKFWIGILDGVIGGFNAWDRARSSQAWKSFRKLVGKPIEPLVERAPTEAEAKATFAARTFQREPEQLVQIRPSEKKK